MGNEKLVWKYGNIRSNIISIKKHILNKIRIETGIIIDERNLNYFGLFILLFILGIISINVIDNIIDRRNQAVLETELTSYYIYVNDATNEQKLNAYTYFDNPSEYVFIVDKENHEKDSYDELPSTLQTFVDDNLKQAEPGLYTVYETYNAEEDLSSFESQNITAFLNNENGVPFVGEFVSDVKVMPIDNFEYMYTNNFLNNEAIAFVNKDNPNGKAYLPAISELYSSLNDDLLIFVYDDSYDVTQINNLFLGKINIPVIPEDSSDIDTNDVITDIDIITDSGLSLVGFDEYGNVVMLKNDYINYFVQGPGLCDDKQDIIYDLIDETSELLSDFYQMQIEFDTFYSGELLPLANCELPENNVIILEDSEY